MEIKLLTCAKCAAVFEAKTKQQKSAATKGQSVFCTDDCRTEYARAYQAEYYQQNRDELNIKKAWAYFNHRHTSGQTSKYAGMRFCVPERHFGAGNI